MWAVEYPLTKHNGNVPGFNTNTAQQQNDVVIGHEERTTEKTKQYQYMPKYSGGPFWRLKLEQQE